ncbi:restriction endonuclease subunit S, partial [Vibrio anguillarum]
MVVENLITEHIDIWTSAVKTKSTSGRGSSKKLELYGVKKLRELILELAVRGKLVPQDSNDEPASVLLERIELEKAQLVKEKKIKKPKTLQTLSPESLPRLPESWTCSYMQDITEYVQRGKCPKYAEEGSVRVISQKCVQNSGFDIEPARYIEEESLEKYQDDRFLKENDLLWNSTGTGTVGRVNVLPSIKQKSLVADSHVTVVRPLIMNSRYIWCILMAPGVQARIDPFHEQSLVSGSTKQVELNTSSVVTLPIPVAPIAEQHRIVDKVDELMALCDQLEQQTETSIEAHQVLVTTLLDTLTNSADADELMQNWARISEHFDTLFTTEESIDQLKQTILQLAVMGKLVPQDPSDEPVSKLLERIKNHQLDRVQRKEIQKPKKASVSTILKMDIPKCWKSLLLNDLVFVTKLAGFEYTKYINLEDAGDVAVIRAQNVRPFKPDLENLKFIDNETSLSLPRSAIDRPSLLVTFIGAGIGDVCVFNEEKRWHLAPNVAKIEPYADLNLEYLCIYLNSPVGRGELFKSMKSTAQPSLSMTTIREIWVALPPVDEQKRIVTEV